MLCFIWATQKSAIGTLISEYHFYNLSSSATSFPSINNSTAQNTYYKPSAFQGSSYASNDPTILSNGILIEHNKYIVANGPHLDSTNSDYHMFQLWMYLAKGDPGPFFNIDIEYATTYISSIVISVRNSSGTLLLDHTPPGGGTVTTSQPMLVGWNLVVALNN